MDFDHGPNCAEMLTLSPINGRWHEKKKTLKIAKKKN